MRISDIALSTSTPVSGARPQARKAADTPGSQPPVVTTARTEGAPHPDEVAAAALQKAAGLAQATRVVAAQNELASASVRGDGLDASRVV